MRVNRLFVSAVLLLSASLVVAAPKVKPEDVRADIQRFHETKAQIERAISDRTAYSELTGTQRREVLDALGRMEERLSNVSSVDELPQDVRIALLNDQELVNTRLTKAAEESRVVCKQERKTGSHRSTTQCRTVAEIRRMRSDSQDFGRELVRSRMEGPAATGGR